MVIGMELFLSKCISRARIHKDRFWLNKKRLAARKARIAVDMDETIADSLKEHLSRFNAAFGTSLSRQDLNGKRIIDLAPSARRGEAERLVRDSSFFEKLEVIDNAQEVVRVLAQQHEIIIVSSAMEIPESFDAKYRWLQKHFSFIPASNILFCGDKQVINADYLIDDHARHFANFRGTGILFTAPHNVHESVKFRVRSWNEIRQLFLG